MAKADETVMTPFGAVPKWVDCKRCGAKLACKFSRVTHSQPCDDCKNTKEYELEEKKKEEEMKGFGIDRALKNQEAKAVFTGFGRNFYTNHKGDIIKDEPYRPLKAGK